MQQAGKAATTQPMANAKAPLEDIAGAIKMCPQSSGAAAAARHRVCCHLTTCAGGIARCRSYRDADQSREGSKADGTPSTKRSAQPGRLMRAKLTLKADRSSVPRAMRACPGSSPLQAGQPVADLVQFRDTARAEPRFVRQDVLPGEPYNRVMAPVPALDLVGTD